MEQYGHIEDVYSGEKKKRGPIGWILRIFLLIIIVGVCGLILFRIWTQETYPSAMEEVYFNQTLRAHYDATGGDMDIYTQKIRIPYDDSDDGNFFSHALFLIPKAEQLQITVRYNSSSVRNLREEYGQDLLPDDSAFIYKLVASDGQIYSLSEEKQAERFMYRYRKLIFDGVKFPLPHECEIVTDAAGNQSGSFYFTLNIYIEGIEEPIARLPIYETHMLAEDGSDKAHLYVYNVKKYELSKGERPHD